MTPELEALKAEALAISCADYAARAGWGLKRISSAEIGGPCPKCGGTDRFGINIVKNAWSCRGCGVAGYDVISMVNLLCDLKFVAALEDITGRRAAEPIDPERQRQLQAEAEEKRRRDAEVAERYREKARKDGWQVWRHAAPAVAGDAVAQYLERRGLGAIDLAAVKLSCFDSKIYWDAQVERWRGPAMIAAVQQPDGRFGAVHQTWIDLDQPKGKVALTGGDGKPLPAKKVLGVKKGGAIRLVTPKGARRIVMGEGIETTLTAFVHNPEPDTAYWAGVDLGNMAGRAGYDVEGKRQQHLPDLDDRECFLPPDWCEELVYLCDGDEPEKHTLDKVLRGLTRAAVLRAREKPELPPLVVNYVPPTEGGGDLNDLVMARPAPEQATA